MKRFALILLAVALPLAAQPLKSPAADVGDVQHEAPWFWQTGSWYRNVIAPKPPLLQLRAPVKLEDYLAGDKLELSLRAYLELVLMNNTDIEIQRVNVETQKNAIQRAFGVFDPLLTTGFNATRSTSPTVDQLAGASTLSNLNQPFNIGYTQTLATGTQIRSTFGWTKISNNSIFQTVNPAYNSSWQAGFTQPLLRNRGREIARLPITIARVRLRGSQFNVEDQIIRLLQNAEVAYWNLIEATEALKVQEEGLALADKSLKRTMRELELGAVSALDIFQPQQTYATSEIAVTQARFRVAQSEDQLRRQMGADLNPRFRTVPIVLTEPVLPPSDDTGFDKEKLVTTALERRPDLRNARNDLDVDELAIRSAANALKPNFNLVGNYTSQGVGGNIYQRPFGAPNSVAPTLVSTGGLGSSLDQLFGFGFPVYNMGLQLNFPLRDRRAAADYADALVSRKLDALQVRQTEQNIRLDVLNRINQVENSKASVRLAQVAVDFAQKRLDAEQKKYDLGTITIFFLLDAQNALVNARAQLVQQSLQYRRNLVNLLQSTGTLLEERNIVLEK
ncbi:MAG: TolC family protein [Bryobacteraceae bacterium]|nr:TolC family protein [Bryobacteraceae bacterium]